MAEMKEITGLAVQEDAVQDFPCRLYESNTDAEHILKVELDWHEDPEILYFKSGHYRLTLDMKEYEITDECFCLVNPGVLHRLESLEGGEKGTEYSVRFPLDMLKFRVPDLAETAIIQPLSCGELRFSEFVTVSDLGFLQILRNINDMIRRFRDFGTDAASIGSSRCYQLPAPADQLLMKAELLRLIGTMDSFGMLHSCEPREEDRQVKVIKDSMNYIRDHFHEKIYIRDLAEITGLNEQYFIRFFGSAVGLPPLEYINRYRIRQAVARMLEKDAHIYEVAESCGFHNIGNFIKIFRSVTGETPHRFRKNLI